MAPGYCPVPREEWKRMGEMTAAAQQSTQERTAEGVVVELLPSALVRISLEREHEIVAHPAGARQANFVRLRIGDRVRVALSPVDRTRGRVLELLTKG